MRKSTLLFAAALLVASQGFASYIVVLKDGTRYKAKEKWKTSNSQAIITLETGTVIQVPVGLIDQAETDKTNALGLGDAKVIAVQSTPATSRPAEESALSKVRIRKQETPAPQPANMQRSNDSLAEEIPSEVLRKFTRAYENVGLYDAKVVPLAGKTIKVQLTADTEENVRRAISATAYMLINVDDIRLEGVQLLMGQLNGGAAGRFQMNRDDAQSLVDNKLNWQAYYVRKVIF